MTRYGIAAVSLFLAGCSTEAVRTPTQAMDIALSSDCATVAVTLLRGEKMPTEWKVERVGDNWHVWLPPDPDGPDKDTGGWLKGAWLKARDGSVDHCEVRVFSDLPPLSAHAP